MCSANHDRDSNIHLGTSGWSYRDWVGPFYPRGTGQRDFLKVYGTVFNTVEIDSTFYSAPKRTVVDAWVERSPDGFIFCPKLPRQLSHEPGGLDPRSGILHLFLDRIAPLGDKLGPILIQMPPTFGPEGEELLYGFLTGLPPAFRYAVELRHPGWRTDATVEMLRELDMAWVIGVGTAGESHRPLTTDFTYIRWLGDRRIERFHKVQIDRSGEFTDWAGWIDDHREHLPRIFGFVNNHYLGHSPAGVIELLKRLELPVPPLPESPADRQGDLFG